MSTAQRSRFSPNWSEGRYFDLWMVVHFLAGVAGGFSNVFFQLPRVGVYALAAALMLGWEAGEYTLGVRESWPNRVLDIGVGLMGVWAALTIGDRLSPQAETWSFVLSLATGLVLMAFGLRAFNRRARMGRDTTAV